MRRFMLSLALVASLLVPAAASAASERCSVTVSPSVGSPTDVFRILVGVTDLPRVRIDRIAIDGAQLLQSRFRK